MAGKTSEKSGKVAEKAAVKQVRAPTLLAGGNPQIEKADGDSPVQAYIAAMPGWFLSFHCFTKYVKVTFLRGASLRPLPPVESKHKDVRYFHIPENGQLEEGLVASWVRQASEVPGDPLF